MAAPPDLQLAVALEQLRLTLTQGHAPTPQQIAAVPPLTQLIAEGRASDIVSGGRPLFRGAAEGTTHMAHAPPQAQPAKRLSSHNVSHCIALQVTCRSTLRVDTLLAIPSRPPHCRVT